MIRRLTTTIALAVAVHQIDTLRRSIMTIRDDIAAVTGQLGKARDEILGKLAELEQKIVDGTVTADAAPVCRNEFENGVDIVELGLAHLHSLWQAVHRQFAVTHPSIISCRPTRQSSAIRRIAHIVRRSR